MGQINTKKARKDRRIKSEEHEIAVRLWNLGQPIGSPERRLVGKCISHPRAHITEAEAAELAKLAEEQLEAR
jgi:hypothetical protein